MDKLELPSELPINSALAIRLGSAVVFHPFELSKVLMQLGHEPIAPRQSKTLFGTPKLALPSVFQYCGHIRKTDGVLGLWRGVTPRLLTLTLSHYTEAKFNELYPPEDQEEEDDERLTLEERKEKFIRRTGRDLACKLACIFISQPLHVITVRAMAEFIGGEDQYSGGLTAGIVNGVQSIIQENGILGFWSGLVPRALGELGIVGLTAGLTFAVNNYLVEDKDMKSYTRHVASFLAGSLFYPLQVTSSCMTVSRSGLRAGYPPNMPFYTSWTNCFSHLRAQGQLKRGSSLFFRYYTGPQVIVGGRVIPADGRMFKSPLKKE